MIFLSHYNEFVFNLRREIIKKNQNLLERVINQRDIIRLISIKCYRVMKLCIKYITIPGTKDVLLSNNLVNVSCFRTVSATGRRLNSVVK